MIVPDVLVTEPPPQVPLAVKSEPQEYTIPGSTTTTETNSNRNNNNVIARLPDNVTDEERRKQVRRMRNKEAAARCRKRRLDQTVTLQSEVDQLESVKSQLKQELEALQSERDKLRGILDLHECSVEAKKPKLESS